MILKDLQKSCFMFILFFSYVNTLIKNIRFNKLLIDKNLLIHR
jgi:hypothetical protein